MMWMIAWMQTLHQCCYKKVWCISSNKKFATCIVTLLDPPESKLLEIVQQNRHGKCTPTIYHTVGAPEILKGKGQQRGKYSWNTWNFFNSEAASSVVSLSSSLWTPPTENVILWNVNQVSFMHIIRPEIISEHYLMKMAVVVVVAVGIKNRYILAFRRGWWLLRFITGVKFFFLSLKQK